MPCFPRGPSCHEPHRLETVLEPTRAAVQETVQRFEGKDMDTDRFLRRASGQSFYNTTGYTLAKIANDPEHAATNLAKYIAGFSPNAREVLEKYKFAQQIKELDDAKLLYKVVGRFADLDVRLEVVPNHSMGTRPPQRTSSSPSIRTTSSSVEEPSPRGTSVVRDASGR
ncbi:type I restriction-modification system subunit M N-terminal domain-containing protein [Spirillospora sp. NPDC047418]